MFRNSRIALMLVTDRALCTKRSIDDVVSEAVAGGVDCVQLREKNLDTRSFVEQAQRLKQLLEPTGVPLIINDRVDVALAIGASGVHVGQEDMPVPIARRLLGPSSLIGLSVESWHDVELAEELPVDYLGVSPVFETPTKTNTKGSWGLEGIAKIRAFSRHPLVAIGGLNRDNVGNVIAAGAHGVAVVSALCCADDPKHAARRLLLCVNSQTRTANRN
jgi:thiamine-phosphate pyrophosphorylase